MDCYEFDTEKYNISTHSLTKRLTQRTTISAKNGRAFQLTASRRGWPIQCSAGGRTIQISTHSLTKRLTAMEAAETTHKIFQLTASRRGWLYCSSPSGALDYFNSQPHEEADLLEVSCYQIDQYFNSQPHEEADGNFAQKFLVQNCIFVTITYIVFSVHLLFDFLCIFSSWIYPFAGANAPEKVVCLTFALIISRYL